MHDTNVDGEFGESIRMNHDINREIIEWGYKEDEIRKGLKYAIMEFLGEHKEWIIEKELLNNNGLTILKRIN